MDKIAKIIFLLLVTGGVLNAGFLGLFGKSSKKAAPSGIRASSAAVTSPDEGKYALVVATSAEVNPDDLNNANPVIRRNTVIRLASLKDRKYFKDIARMLDDSDAGVRKITVNSLSIYAEGTDEINRVCGLLLDRLENEKDISVKVMYITALGKFKFSGAVPELEKSMSDSNPLIRTYAVKSLGEINDKATYNSIVKMLDDEVEGIKIESARIIGKNKIKVAQLSLLKYIDYPINSVRLEIIKALGDMGSTEVVRKLEPKLKDSDPSIVSEAESAIKKIRDRNITK